MSEEARLEAEGVEILLCLFPGVRAKGSEEERRELGHGSQYHAATAVAEPPPSKTRRDKRPRRVFAPDSAFGRLTDADTLLSTQVPTHGSPEPGIRRCITL